MIRCIFIGAAVFAALLALTALQFGATQLVLTPTGGSFSANNNAYRVSWTADMDANIITFDIEADTNGWVAIGWTVAGGSGHANTDSVVGYVLGDGSTVLLDQTSSIQRQPDLDGTQNVNLLSSSNAGGVTSISFSRPITSPDNDDDVDIVNGPMSLVWAYGTNDGNAAGTTYQQHSNRGVQNNVNFLQQQDEPGAPTPMPILGDALPNPDGSFTADNGNYNLAWVVDFDSNTITYEMTASTLGWVGVGFSTSGSGHSETGNELNYCYLKLMHLVIVGFCRFCCGLGQP